MTNNFILHDFKFNVDFYKKQIFLKKYFRHGTPFFHRKKRFKILPAFTKKKRIDLIKIQYFFNFGKVGFYLNNLILITEKFIFRLILQLKRIVKKRDKTLRHYWIQPFNPIYLSFASKGARMGKGKGKKLLKFSYYPPLKFFLEFKGLRLGRILYYKKVLSSRLPSNISYLTRSFKLSNRFRFF